MTKYTVSNMRLAANKILADAAICTILLLVAFIGYKMQNGIMILSMSLISGVMVLAANNLIFWLKCRKHLVEKERG